MKILFFGAGPVGSVYANLLHMAGNAVTVLARGERHDWLKQYGLVLRNDLTGEEGTAPVNVVDELGSEDQYDLAVVCIRKNKLPPVFESLAAHQGIKTILFMGNNALGFDTYQKHLPAERLLMGFPGVGGGLRDQVVHYADRETPNGATKSITIGEIDGLNKDRTLAIKSLFETAGVPVDITTQIDGWLKYHVALVSPFVGALYKYDCDNYQVAKDKEMLRTMVRATKEGGRVLRALGFRKRHPFTFNLFYWLPESLVMMKVKRLLESKFAEIAFAMHAKAARDEMADLAREFQQLTAKTSIKTPNIDALNKFVL